MSLFHHLVGRIIFFIPFLWSLSGTDLSAQVWPLGYMDVGSTNVSGGIFYRTAALGQYQRGNYHVGIGLQLDLISSNKKHLSGFRLSAARDFQPGGVPLQLSSFFIYAPYSDLLRQTNWGVILGMDRKHFMAKLGTEFRTFRFTPTAIDHYGYASHESIRENWNLVYSAEYYLKRIGSSWNIGLSLSNMDYFLINQETNPMILIRGTYGVNIPVDLFMEVWHKSAGAFNLSVNHFGFFIRTGVVWKID